MKKYYIVLYILSTVCLLSLGIMVFSLCFSPQEELREFSPPDYDTNAIKGFPYDIADIEFNKVWQEGMSFSAHICGEVTIEADSADIYFTNDSENECLLKLRILNQHGAIIAETGLIHPGEYLKSIVFISPPSDGESIVLKIMSYEPNNYTSMGSVVLNTKAIVYDIEKAESAH